MKIHIIGYYHWFLIDTGRKLRQLAKGSLVLLKEENLSLPSDMPLCKLQELLGFLLNDRETTPKIAVLDNTQNQQKISLFWNN